MSQRGLELTVVFIVAQSYDYVYHSVLDVQIYVKRPIATS